MWVQVFSFLQNIRYLPKICRVRSEVIFWLSSGLLTLDDLQVSKEWLSIASDKQLWQLIDLSSVMNKKPVVLGLGFQLFSTRRLRLRQSEIPVDLLMPLARRVPLLRELDVSDRRVTPQLMTLVLQVRALKPLRSSLTYSSRPLAALPQYRGPHSLQVPLSE